MNKPKIYSILDTLSSNQIDSLIQEERLRNKGYSFFYTIDQYDIQRYCFPIGIWELDKEYDVEYLSDQFVALIDLFENNQQILLLDQYIDEFYQFRGILIEALFTKRRFVDEVRSFSSYLESENSNIRNDFGILISTATGILIDGVSRFNNIIRKKKIIISDDDYDSDWAAKPMNQLTIEAIIDSKKIREDNVDKLTKLSKKIKEGDQIRRDCEAIDRVSQVNEKLIEKNNKTLLLFVSSAPAFRNVYFNKDSNVEYPKIEGVDLNFHRSSAQIFLQLLLKGEKDIIDQLKYIKDIILKRESAGSFDSEDLEKNFQYRLRQLRNRFAHEKLLRRFDEYEKLNTQFEIFSEKTNKFNESSYQVKRLKTLFDELQFDFQNRGSKKIGEHSIKLLDSINYEYELKRHFIDWLNRANESQDELLFIIQRGKDPVFGTGHHLPLFFKSEGQQSQLISAIAKQYIKQEVAMLDEDIKSANAKIKSFIKENLKNYWQKKISIASEPEDVFIMCLLLLIIPIDREKLSIDLMPEYIVSKIVEKYIEHINNKTDKNNRLSDYLYLLVWVNRRLTDYKKARRFANKGNKLFPNDPRFKHGLLLIEYCKFREHVPNVDLPKKIDNDAVKLLKSAISNGILALILYNGINIDENDIVFKKNKAALMVGMVLIYSYLFHYEGLNSWLAKGRELLSELKEYENNHYENQPEYRYVESVLEYQEYIYLKNNGEIKKANEKLKYAKIAIEKSYNRIPSRTQYKDWHAFLNKIIDE